MNNSSVKKGHMIRSDEANRRMWAMLSDVSNQVDWPVNGTMRKMPKEDWKDVFTAGLLKEQRIAQGLEGGFVMLGCRTRDKSRAWMTKMIDLIMHFGDSRGVKWSDPELVQMLKHYEVIE